MKYMTPKVWEVSLDEYHIDGRGERFPYEEAFVKEWMRRKFCKLFYKKFYPVDFISRDYYGWCSHFYRYESAYKDLKCEHFHHCYPGVFEEKQTFLQKIQKKIKKCLAKYNK